MADVQGRVRERLRLHLVRHGAAAFEDPALFAEVEQLLRSVDRCRRLARAHPARAARRARLVAARDGDALGLAPPEGRGRGGPVHQAPPAHAALPVAVRVQPRQLRAAAAGEPGAVRLRAGARARERPPPPRPAAPRDVSRVKPHAPLQAEPPSREARLRGPALRRRHRRRVRSATVASWRCVWPPGTTSPCSPPAPPTTSPGPTSSRPASRWTAGVRVRRFPVRRPRRLKRFAEISDEVFDGRAPPSAAGGMVPRERPRLPRPARLPARRGHALRPGAVLDVPLRAVVLRRAARARSRGAAAHGRGGSRDGPERSRGRSSGTPAGYLFLTPEEETLVSTRAGQPLRAVAVIGMGLEPALRRRRRRARPARAPRRVPCCTWAASIATRAATRCSSTSPSTPAVTTAPSLVLAGPAKMQMPAHPRIRALGCVSDDERDALLQSRAGAGRALAVREPEHRAAGRVEPRRAGDRQRAAAPCCKGQVRRANGGLYYRSSAEFAEAVQTLRAVGTRPPRAGRAGAAPTSSASTAGRW